METIITQTLYVLHHKEHGFLMEGDPIRHSDSVHNSFQKKSLASFAEFVDDENFKDYQILQFTRKIEYTNPVVTPISEEIMASEFDDLYHQTRESFSESIADPNNNTKRKLAMNLKYKFIRLRDKLHFTGVIDGSKYPLVTSSGRELYPIPPRILQDS